MSEFISERFAYGWAGAGETRAHSHSQWETERTRGATRFACSTTPTNSIVHPTARGAPHPPHPPPPLRVSTPVAVPVRSVAPVPPQHATLSEPHSVRPSERENRDFCVIRETAAASAFAGVEQVATPAPGAGTHEHSVETASPTDVDVFTTLKEQSIGLQEEEELLHLPALDAFDPSGNSSDDVLLCSPRSHTPPPRESVADAGDTESEPATADFQTALESSRGTSPVSEYADAESSERGAEIPAPADDATLVEPR